MIILTENRWLDIEMSLQMDAPIEEETLRAALQSLIQTRGRSDREKELEEEVETLATDKRDLNDEIEELKEKIEEYEAENETLEEKNDKIESLGYDIERLEGNHELFTETVSQDFRTFKTMIGLLVKTHGWGEPIEQQLENLANFAANCVEQHCE